MEPLEVTTRRVGGAATGGDGLGAGASGAAAGADGASATGAGAWAAGAGAAGASGAADASASGAFALALDALTGFSGSGGCSSRISPSRSALRRTRSACASSMLDECVFTAMPRSTHRSRVSLLERPSSLPSSWTRIFAANVCSPALRACCQDVSPEVSGTVVESRAAGGPCTKGDVACAGGGGHTCSRTASTAALVTGALNDRAKPPRREASSMHAGEPKQSQAPRPGSVRPTTSVPSSERTRRTRSAG